MKRIFIYIIFEVFFGLIFAQNIIQNSGFEHGTPGYPNAQGQAYHCDYWHGETSTDWFGPNHLPPQNNNHILPDNPGKYYVGFYDISRGEGLKQHLQQFIPKYSLVNVKLKYARDNGNGYSSSERINIALNNVQNGGNYENPTHYIPIENIYGKWKEYETGYAMVYSDASWILVYSEQVPSALQYYYIDDVELEYISICSQPCGPATQPPQLGFTTNLFSPNGDGVNDVWVGKVYNITAYDIEVYDRWGGMVYKQYNYKPQTLSYNTNQQCVSWNGTRNVGWGSGQLVSDGAYSVKIKLRNCDKETGWFLLDGDDQVHLIGGNGQVSNLPDYIFNINTWVCCSEDYYISNEYYTSGIDYQATNNITAINTVIPTGIKVTFNAGNSILLSDGFVAKYGSGFKAWIEGCILSKPLNKNTTEIMLEDTILGANNQFLLSVNPNPFSNALQINYELVNSQIVELSLYDILGKKYDLLELSAQSGEQPAGTHELRVNTASLPSGTYFLRIRVGDDVEHRKLVKM